jgi:superfamily II DNA/RNA helicase
MGIKVALLSPPMTREEGSSDRNENLAALKAGVHIAVATPGRLWDLTSDSKGSPTWHKSVKTLVMDEVDMLLSGDSRAQMGEVWLNLPQKFQLGLFSATMPQDVQERAESLLGADCFSSVGAVTDLPSSIKHYAMNAADTDSKVTATLNLLAKTRVPAIVFCSSMENVKGLTCALQENLPADIRVAAVSDKAIADFTSGKIQCLVTTSVLARGFDTAHLQLVINFDLPKGPGWYETYVHQSGRCGRGGCVGVCVTLLDRMEAEKVGKMAARLGIHLMPLEESGIAGLLK